MIRTLAVALVRVPSSVLAVTTRCVNPLGSGGCKPTIQVAVSLSSPGDVVEIEPGTYVENVVVTSPKRIVLRGAGPDLTRIDGGGGGPALQIGTGVNATVSGIAFENGTFGIDLGEQARLTLSDCEATGNEVGIQTGVRSTAFVTSCEVTGNTGGGFASRAAGVDARGKLTLTSSTVSGNAGDGVYAQRAFKIIDSTVAGNQGNGVWNSQPGKVAGSTISDNAGVGLYVRSVGTVRVGNSTISGNGLGGVDVSVRVDLDHVTITGNSATFEGGGVRAMVSAKAILRSTIIAGNSAPIGPDCSSSGLRAVGPSLIGDPSGCTVSLGAPAVINGDPLLGPLQDNGGPTETHALLPGSPAIGLLTVPGACRSPDQRGVVRAVPCDLGAYETP